MREDQDEVIGRVVSELQVLPKVQSFATERVLARIAAQRSAAAPVTPIRSAPDRRLRGDAPRPDAPRRRTLSLSWAISLSAAATVAGFLIRGITFDRRDARATAAATGTQHTSGVAVTPATAAPSRERDEAAVQTQFVLARPGATRVSLVGDFNAWDAHRTPMVRSADGDIWSVALPLTPGRHAYAFVVDDSLWTLDPRAANERDADYGRSQSVIVVGRP